ncbi:BgTH12-00684 [Blumeria graminis f. sp. triticale]|uniref:Bgt-849 n=3 Tax=Blumeria graminis TaxID=34373 RepID=A0A061HG30_BLUGR|nr:hypothetical protein BGT96224_849 [Blumeria graminis f. sp. tritici 96224]CAD6505189.1 BgTH12-00684 [Blumeria graminis f. sp. triticale]VDB93205.1 Bgt-849 [Blumeria graminis f. sp. tritici]
MAPPVISPRTRRPSRPSINKIRNGTFILPSTGERLQHQITLVENSSVVPKSYACSITSNASRQQPRLRRSLADIMRHELQTFWHWMKSPTGKGILKCSLGYLLGSMGTFLPPLTNFLGRQDGKHILATITVYFHPARSAGSMVEAAVLGLAAFLYATFVGISSMAVSVFFETQLDLIEVAYGLILIVFCGGGLGLVGWFKQAYNSPLVSVACSLTSLAIISIVTKENAIQTGVFSNDKIIQVMKMVSIGIASTACICFLIWPVSARLELQKTMIKTTESVGEMLSLISQGFISGSDTGIRSGLFTNTQKKHKVLFTQLTKCLREARFEHYILGTENQYKNKAKLVNCLERLALSIGGLKSAATTQLTLLKESSGISSSTPTNNSRCTPESFFDLPLATNNGRADKFAVLKSIEEVVDELGFTSSNQKDTLPQADNYRSLSVISAESSYLPTIRTPSEIFSRFIMLLGPSIKSLAYTLSQILQQMPFCEDSLEAITVIEQFKKSLGGAMTLYSNARSEALKELYKSKELNRERPASIEADFEEVAASCGHFSFSLLTFAKEMQNLMDILEELKEQTEDTHRSWKWLKFWRKRQNPSTLDPEEEPLVERIPDNATSRRYPDIILNKQASEALLASQRFPDILGSFAYRLISFAKMLDRDDVRFAIKVGIGASLYALLAFIPATRPIYQLWRGEWGLLSYMLVCSMTIGASNTTGYSRFIGTFIGAVIANIVWIICQGNPFALAFCGWLISLPCFYLIVARGMPAFGRFVMLTYNLSCLYAYSMSIQEREDDKDEGGIAPIISTIALHRLVAVFVGVIWGLIVTRIIWPISARQKFQHGLSLLWLRMGLIWKRDPLATLLDGESTVPYMDIREEFALHRYLLRLENLRNSAKSEFELRGPFPAKEFENIMDSTSNILDSLHAMNDIIQSNKAVSEGETFLLQYTSNERAHLCSLISHLFHVIASSLKIEYPMSDALPSILQVRDRLLSKIFKYRKTSVDAELTGVLMLKDEDYESLYAFILVTGQLAEDFNKVEKQIINLYGVMNEDILRLT